MYSALCTRTKFVILIGMFFYSSGNQITTNTLWENCDTTVCGPRNLSIPCEVGSKILIGNVTSGKDRAYANSYSNLRRMCLGMNRCNASGQGFCNQYSGAHFDVSYVCVPETIIEHSCQATGKILTEKAGFITSPNYPSLTSFRKCKWKISVPADHYVHVYLHEVLYNVLVLTNCEEGLRFSAVNTCGMSFPTFHVCHESQVTAIISACSDIEILLPSAKQNMRFLLSYAVVKVPSLQQVSMYNTGITCNVEIKDQFTYLPLPETDTEESVNITVPSTNSTVHADKSHDESDDDIDYVVIIGFAVGILVIITIVVIAFIYIRCRLIVIHQERKESKNNISNSNSQTNCSEIQKRPLPDTLPDCMIDDGQPELQQSYSEVRDHIPITSAPLEHTMSPTYAEIEEFEPSKSNPKPPLAAKRSVDNSKRELPAKPHEAAHSSTYSEIEVEDAKDAESEKTLNAKNKKNKEKIFPNYFYKKKLSNASNIYAECEDVSKVEKDKTYMDMSHKKLEESEYVPHTKDSKDKVNLSKKCKVSDNTAGTNIPFADSEVKKKGTSQSDVAEKTGRRVRKDSVTSESDSDEDICIVENELYEPFESAKV